MGQMRRLARSVALVATCWTALGGASVAGASPEHTEASLRARIERRATSARAADVHAADTALAFIEEERVRLGVRNVIFASADLIREAEVALQAGDPGRAEELGAAATRLSPDLSAGYWMWLRAVRADDWTRLADQGTIAWWYLRAQLTVFRNRVALAAWGFTWAMWVLVLACGLFGGIQLLRHLTYAAHDLARPLPGIFTRREVILALLFGLGALGLLLSWAAAVAVGLALVYAYQGRSERLLSFLAVASLALAPAVIYGAGAPLIAFHGSKSDVLAAAESQVFMPEEQHALGPSADRDALGAAILAQRMRARGDLAGAEAEYRRALKGGPGDPSLENNLGAVLYRRKQFAEAERRFRAGAADGRRLEPVLNLATVLYDRGAFKEAEQVLAQARSIDPERTAAYIQRRGTAGVSHHALDAGLAMGVMWQRLYRQQDPVERMTITRQLWAPVGGDLPLLQAGLGLLVVFLVGLIAGRRTVSHPCDHCGVPVRSEEQSCYACKAVYGSGSFVDHELRTAKEAQLFRRQRRRRWVSVLLGLVAGLGRIYRGRTLMGALWLLLFLGLLGIGLQVGGALSVNAWRIPVDDGLWRTLSHGALGLAALMSLWSVITGARET